MQVWEVLTFKKCQNVQMQIKKVKTRFTYSAPQAAYVMCIPHRICVQATQ